MEEGGREGEKVKGRGRGSKEQTGVSSKNSQSCILLTHVGREGGGREGGREGGGREGGREGGGREGGREGGGREGGREGGGREGERVKGTDRSER